MSRLCNTARALLGVTLATALLAAPVRAADMDKYLPDHTLLVVTFNVKQLLSAPLVKTDEKAFNRGMGEAGKVLEGFGVNPAKDISRVVIAAGEQMQPKNVLVLLEGNFNPSKVQDKLAELAKDPKNNLEATKEDGATVYEGKVPKQALPNPTLPNHFYLTVLDNNTIAFAVDKDALKESLAKKSGGRKAEVKKQVLDLVGKISPHETLSIVLVPPAEMLAGSPAAGLSDVTGGVTVGEGVKTEFKLATKDAEAAKTLATVIEGSLNQVKQIVPAVAASQPGFGPKEQKMVQELMDSIKTTAQGNDVLIKSNISKEYIEKNSKKDQ
jgi:hypothetical protein